MARFIVFEGGEASGKSTQSVLLAERLDAVHTHEPGGTDLGAALRALLLDAHTTGLSDRAEALLMAADRAQHVAEVVRPALAQGRHVVSDRYAGSTLAYQGYGRGLPVFELRRLSGWAANELWPDRMEAAGEAFHDRVLRGYQALAAADPARWAVVDGTAAPGEVAQAVWESVTTRLPDLADG
jgi:dTMP kinase